MSSQEKIELEYLQSDQIGKVIAQGLAELVQQKPKFPVDYLAKWLLNHSSTQNYKKQQDQEEVNRQNLIKEHQERQSQQVKEAEQQQQEKEQDQEVDAQFETKISQSEYHNEFILDEFPQFLQDRKELTGCYVGKYDHPVQEIDDNNEDEKAHLNTEQRVINYIGYSQEQKPLMQGKTLNIDQGVTGEVFKEKEPVEQQEGDEGQAPPEQQNYVYVPDVVKEPRMHYFRLPKLGAYLAVPLIYNSCLSENSFDLALEERQRYRADKEEKDKEKEQKELEFQEQLKGLEEEGQDTAELIQNYEAEKAAFEDAQEAPFQYEKQEYVVCCDTLGQDREIPKDDILYLEKFTQLFAQNWEQREQELLSQDVDRQINYLEGLPSKYTDIVEQFNEQEEQHAQDKEGNFIELKDTNEKEFNYEMDCAKLEKVREQLSDKTNQDYFLNLKEYRVIKFPGIIQNILYLLGYKREKINLPDTHILNWKKVRSEILNEQLFEQILNYNHRGSKPDQVPPYAYVNRITDKIAKYDENQVDAYNITFGRLLKWLRYTCQLRKLDIEIRREKITQRKLDREQILQENETTKQEKEAALEAKRAEAAENEEQEGFDEAEWEKNYDEEHPLKEVPEEVVDQEDNDCEFFD